MKQFISRPAQDQKPSIVRGSEQLVAGILHGGEEIQPGTLHGRGEILPSGTLCATYSPGTYRTRDGQDYYKFRFVESGGKFEIDILSQPSYRGRNESAHISHRLPSDRGGRKICVAQGHEPTSLSDAHNLAMGWAELTNTYIKRGITLDDQINGNSRY